VKLPDTAEVIFEPGPRRRMGLARGQGPLPETTAPGSAWLLIEHGRGELHAGSHAATIGGRDDVFGGPGWSALIAPGETFSVAGPAHWILVWRPPPLPGEDVTRLIAPDQVVVEERGTSPAARTVRTYVAQGSLICGETLNPPGGWSSWPPHRHEHDELYHYRFSSADGFGVHLHDADPTLVRDGAAEYIESGYHPVVAAPASAMYYLWALAGEDVKLSPEQDPRYAEIGGP
jgi:5-deoxy-glucuronate isomerase